MANIHSQMGGLCHTIKKHNNSLLERTHNLHGTLLNAVLLDDLPVMQHVKLLSGILTSVQHDCLLATRVIGKEGCHIEDVITDDHPAVLVGVVLGNVGRRMSHVGELPNCK